MSLLPVPPPDALGNAPPGAAGRTAPAQNQACLHCGTPLDLGGEGAFCCGGCRTVHELLRASGLERYYALRGAGGPPVPETDASKRDLKWLEALEERVTSTDGVSRLELDVQGIHCAACVWLVQELFRREPGAVRVVVNPALGRIDLAVEGGFPLREFVRGVERFGYLFGPPVKSDSGRSSALVLRMGVTAALAVNSMIFAIAIYLGLDAGPLYDLVRTLGYVLAVASVLVGGGPFLSSAWQGLRRGVVHVDTTIALGIVLAFAGSVWSFHFRQGAATYFDTLCVFVALMLVGRWLQERVLERNRRLLLASDGIEGLLARRVEPGGRLALVACSELRAGDTVLVAPGDVVPVDSQLDDEHGSFSLDWIQGESTPRAFRRGAAVPAGAFNVGARAATVRAETDFSASPLVALLRATVEREKEGPRSTRWWQRYASLYVSAVLSIAAVALAGWWWRTGDLGRALEVATSVLVITCPCAFGIATPLAYELVQSGLRRVGLFVRAAGFLDRAQRVRRIVFDKTGTLTTGVLGILDEAPLATLDAAEQRALYNLVARSNHPKALAVRRALERVGAQEFVPGADVTELPGAGLELSLEGHVHRLGRPGWAGSAASMADTDVVYTVDGVTRVALCTSESLRRGAAAEIARLAADGYELWILSGDTPENVARLAATIGIASERAVGGLSPEDKSAWLAAHDREDTLMIGDGLNDSLAVERAWCAGTPAVDRPFLPSRADFFFTSAGLEPIRLALRAARRLGWVTRRNLAFAIAYNVAAVSVACAGLMTPWLAAILMPASSLTIVLATLGALSGEARRAERGRVLSVRTAPALAGGSAWK